MTTSTSAVRRLTRKIRGFYLLRTILFATTIFLTVKWKWGDMAGGLAIILLMGEEAFHEIRKLFQAEQAIKPSCGMCEASITTTLQTALATLPPLPPNTSFCLGHSESLACVIRGVNKVHIRLNHPHLMIIAPSNRMLGAVIGHEVAHTHDPCQHRIVTFFPTFTVVTIMCTTGLGLLEAVGLILMYGLNRPLSETISQAHELRADAQVAVWGLGRELAEVLIRMEKTPEDPTMTIQGLLGLLRNHGIHPTSLEAVGKDASSFLRMTKIILVVACVKWPPLFALLFLARVERGINTHPDAKLRVERLRSYDTPSS